MNFEFSNWKKHSCNIVDKLTSRKNSFFFIISIWCLIIKTAVLLRKHFCFTLLSWCEMHSKLLTTHIGPILLNRFKFPNIWNHIFKSRLTATKSELGQCAVRNVVENVISDTFLQECKVRGKYNISWKQWCWSPRAAPWQRRPARGKNQPQRTTRNCHELPKHKVALIGQLPWGACSSRLSEHWSFIRHVISRTMAVIGSIRGGYGEAIHMEKTGKNRLEVKASDE